MTPIKLAIADDHLLFAKGLKAIFDTSDEFDLLFHVSNGVELLNKLAETDTQPDVILTDLKMPEMDGMEATKRVQETYPDIRVIVLTMHKDENYILHMIECGANGYLLKDVDSHDLEEAVKAVAERGFYFDAYISDVMRKGLIARNRRQPVTGLKVSLTAREQEVLELICQELTAKEIGEKLFLSPRTVEGHWKSLLAKTGTRNVAGLVLFAVKNGMVV